MARPIKPHTNSRAGETILAQDGPDGFWTFRPRTLPPRPPRRIEAGLQDRLDGANQALGRLDGSLCCCRTRTGWPLLYLSLFLKQDRDAHKTR